MNKMLIDRKLVKQALKALENCGGLTKDDAIQRVAAIIALKAALAEPVEPVQEPIGYLWPTGRHPEFRFTQQKRDGIDGTPVYTSPPQRKPVEWDGRCMLGHCNSPAGCENSGECRAVERAHGIGGEG